MNTKLTLSLDATIIEKAKVYAKAHNTSLSKLIERYLSRVARVNEGYSDKSVVVDELAGMLNDPASGSLSYKDAKYKHLRKKYGL